MISAYTKHTEALLTVLTEVGPNTCKTRHSIPYTACTEMLEKLLISFRGASKDQQIEDKLIPAIHNTKTKIRGM